LRAHQSLAGDFQKYPAKRGLINWLYFNCAHSEITDCAIRIADQKIMTS
jgi:hypothetical protein